jgi:hypothetical protein
LDFTEYIVVCSSGLCAVVTNLSPPPIQPTSRDSTAQTVDGDFCQCLARPF